MLNVMVDFEWGENLFPLCFIYVAFQNCVTLVELGNTPEQSDSQTVRPIEKKKTLFFQIISKEKAKVNSEMITQTILCKHLSQFTDNFDRPYTFTLSCSVR